MYKNEKGFAHALVSLLRKDNTVFLQRIESGAVGYGIPDLFIKGAKKSTWVELKNNAKKQDHSDIPVCEVGWRKGQQIWAFAYRRTGYDCTYTIISYSDCFVIIPMTQVFNDAIYKSYYIQVKTLKEVVNYLLQVLQ